MNECLKTGKIKRKQEMESDIDHDDLITHNSIEQKLPQQKKPKFTFNRPIFRGKLYYGPSIEFYTF